MNIFKNWKVWYWPAIIILAFIFENIFRSSPDFPIIVGVIGLSVLFGIPLFVVLLIIFRK